MYLLWLPSCTSGAFFKWNSQRICRVEAYEPPCAHIFLPLRNFCPCTTSTAKPTSTTATTATTKLQNYFYYKINKQYNIIQQCVSKVNFLRHFLKIYQLKLNKHLFFKSHAAFSTRRNIYQSNQQFHCSQEWKSMEIKNNRNRNRMNSDIDNGIPKLEGP